MRNEEKLWVKKMFCHEKMVKAILWYCINSLNVSFKKIQKILDKSFFSLFSLKEQNENFLKKKNTHNSIHSYFFKRSS